MAVVTSTLMYGGRNKLGTVVVKTVRGQLVLSQYQPNVLNPRSAGQQEQRGRMAAIVPLWKIVQTIGTFAIKEKKNNQSQYNKFIQNNIIESTIDVGGQINVVYQNLQVSNGSLAPIQQITFTNNANVLTITYAGQETSGTENGTDEIYVGIVSPMSYDSQLSFITTRNTNGTETITLPNYPSGTQAYIYAFTVNPASNRGSRSQYLGIHNYV